MKNYIRPSVEVSKFDVADIITTSGEVQSSSALTGDDLAIYNQYVAEAAVVGTTAQSGAALFQW